MIEKTLSGERIYTGKIISLEVDEVLLPNGGTASREVVLHNGGASIVALTGENDLLMVEQFRYPYRETVLELPAGKLEKVNGAVEDPLEAAKRELREETGATAAKFTPLGVMYPSPGYVSEIIHLYLAEDLTFGETDFDDDEFLSLRRLPLKEAVQLCLDGTIKDAKTICGILKAHMLKGKSDT